MPTVKVSKQSVDSIRAHARGHERMAPAIPALNDPDQFMVYFDQDVLEALLQLDPDINKAIAIATSPTFNPTRH